MKRRSLLLLGALTPLALLRSRYLGAGASKSLSPADYQQRVQQLNEFAANIQTPADARRLVDFVSQLFSGETLYRLKSSSLRNQIAEAEFSAVSDPQKLIPEPRLAQAWNTYVATIGAPEDRKVIPAELHNLRDAFQTTARVLWSRDTKNVWTVPSIYATLPDGRVAPGARAIESIRLIWDLARMPSDNLKGTRDRMSKGVLMSDSLRKPQHYTASLVPRSRMGVGLYNFPANPMRMAQQNYIERNGDKAFSNAVMAMLNDTFTT
jgi:hypothetical protein